MTCCLKEIKPVSSADPRPVVPVNPVPTHLVGVLQDQVLALVQLAADVDDAAEDSPGVLHAQIDLAGELVGFELLGSQDDVARRVLHVVPRHVPEEHTTRHDPVSVTVPTEPCRVGFLTPV